MMSTLTQEQGGAMESFMSAQEFSSSFIGKENLELNDSLKKGSSPPEATDLFQRKSPPLVLSGIPTDARSMDSLDVSRRNSVPIPSGPELSKAAAQKPPPPKKVSPPPPMDDAAEQQEILNVLKRAEPSTSSKSILPSQQLQVVNSKRV